MGFRVAGPGVDVLDQEGARGRPVGPPELVAVDAVFGLEERDPVALTIPSIGFEVWVPFTIRVSIRVLDDMPRLVQSCEPLGPSSAEKNSRPLTAVTRSGFEPSTERRIRSLRRSCRSRGVDVRDHGRAGGRPVAPPELTPWALPSVALK